MTYNAKNFVVNWPATNAVALYNGTLNQSYLDKSIPLINGIPISAPKTGVISYNYLLPARNSRILSLLSSVANVQFQITGLVTLPPLQAQPPYDLTAYYKSSIQTETINAVTQNTTYYSSTAYQKILSIVPVVLPSNITTLQIGYADGYTDLYLADVWNKVNNYSVALSGVAGGSSISLEYSLDNINFFAAHITQPPFVFAPSTLTNPITANGIISFINIPLTSLTLTTARGTNNSFTATIMQQGAAY